LKGTKQSFVEFFADDAVIFHPGPINGKKFYSDQPGRPGLLTWRPVVADISSNNDLGYTTGPWEFRRNGKDDPQVYHGYYFSIWKKQADGLWKVALDNGIDSGGPSPWGMDLMKAPGDSGQKLKAGKETAEDVIALDNKFSQEASSNGLQKAFQQYAVSDILILREGSDPMRGADAMSSLAKQGECTWQAVKAELSGDLAYDYGSGSCKSADKTDAANYVRVWKKQADGSWKVVVDVWTPVRQ
jgi:ketosteroid isomerase-like protein